MQNRRLYYLMLSYKLGMREPLSTFATSIIDAKNDLHEELITT